MYIMHPVPYCRTDINLRQLSFLKMFLVSDDTVFSIDSSTGEITLDDKTSLSDYVTSQSLVAYATDNGTPQKTASATVTITSGSVRSTWYTPATIVLYCVVISLNCLCIAEFL